MSLAFLDSGTVLSTVVWERPALLLAWLPIAIVLWLLGRTRRTETVGSTVIWRELSTAASRSRLGWRLLLVAAIVALAAEPWWASFPMKSPVRVLARPGASGVSLELVWDGPPSAEPATIRVTRTDGGQQNLTLRRDPAQNFTPRGEIARPSVLAVPLDGWPQRVEVEHDGKTFPTAFEPPSRPAVHDATDSPAIARAIAALVATGRCRSVATPEAATVRFVRGATPTAATAATIRLAANDADVVQPFPVPETTRPVDPRLSGLAVEEWPIDARLAIEKRHPRDVVLLDSTGGPLITDGPAGVTLAFDPDASGLIDWPAWPVFVGRLIEERADPLRRTPASGEPPRRLFALLLAVAIALLIRPALGRPPMPLLAAIGLLLLASIVSPELPHGPPRTAEVRDPSNPAAWERERTHLSGPTRRGGILRVGDATSPLPLGLSTTDPDWWNGRVVVEAPPAPARWSVQPSTIALGEPVTIDAPTETALLAVAALGPEGSSARIAIENGRARHTPDAPGEWRYAADDGETRVVWVDAPLEFGVIGDAAGLESLTLAEGVTAIRPSPSEIANCDAILWNGADPARYPELLREVERAVKGGAVLATVAAPPFLEASPARDALEALLPARLPDAPPPPSSAYGVVLLDVSGSVRGAPLDTLARGLRGLLDATPPEGRWGIALFDRTARWWIRPGAPLDDDALARLSALPAGGGTRLDLALDFALNAFAAETGVGRHLVVLTDGRTRDANAIGRWERYGAQLREAGIAVTVVATGSGTGHAPLAALGGELRAVDDPARAAELLAEAIRRPPQRWRDVLPPLSPVGRGPLVADLPRQFRGPTRALRLEPFAEATPLVRDRRGTPLVLTRAVGRGRTVLLGTGFDVESWPDREGRAEFATAVTTAVRNAVRERPGVRRRVTRRVDAAGRHWWRIGRQPEEPSVVTVSWRDDSGRRQEATAFPDDADHWRAPIDSAAPRTVTLDLGGRLEPVVLDFDPARDRSRLAAATARFEPEQGAVSLAPLWAGVLLAFTLGAIVRKRAPARRERIERE